MCKALQRRDLQEAGKAWHLKWQILRGGRRLLDQAETGRSPDRKVKEEEKTRNRKVEDGRKVKTEYKIFFRQALYSRKIYHWYKEAIHQVF